MTRKISRSVAKIHLGQLECFSLGNLDSKRDWGHARDYVEVGRDTDARAEPHTSLRKGKQRSYANKALNGASFPISFVAVIRNLHGASYDSLPKEKQSYSTKGGAGGEGHML